MVRRASIFVCLALAAISVAQLGSVYATKSGTKYHRYECKVLKRSKTVFKMSIRQAKELKLKPCSKCKPLDF